MESPDPAAATPANADDDASLEGRTFRDFLVCERLAAGSFGTVYRAEQPRLGREAVLKFIRTGSGSQSAEETGKLRARLLREVQFAAGFEHPFAAHVYDFGAEPDGLFWIALERVHGMSLADHLGVHGKFTPANFAALGERICEVVQSAHEQGIVHRDIKPANVMILERAGKLFPKLLDFGVACAQGEAWLAEPPLPQVQTAPAESEINNGNPLATQSLYTTTMGNSVGSPAYMAPEQWLDASAAGPPADLYALGVLCFEALAGHTPFTGASIEEVAQAHATQAIPSLDKGPLDAFFARALAKKPDDRFKSALELGQGLRDAAGLAPRSRSLRFGKISAAIFFVAAAVALTALQLWRTSLPASDRHLALFAVDRSGGQTAVDDAWLAPVLTRLTARRLGFSEHRFAVNEDPQQANITVQIVFRPNGSSLELQPEVGRAGGRLERWPAITAASASEAVDALVKSLSERLGKDQPELAPTALEIAAAKSAGARSPEENREYEALKLQSASADSDDALMEKRALALSAADPSWARPYSLLSLVQGSRSAASDATLQRGLAAIDRERDPRGADVLEGISLLRNNDAAGAAKKLGPAFEADPDDLVAGWHLYMAEIRLQQVDLAEDIVRRMATRHPELQLGGVLTGMLRTSGHPEEARSFASALADAAPENENAQQVMIGFELESHQFDEAEKRARHALLIAGGDTGHLLLTGELILSGKLDEARRLAQQGLEGTPFQRSNADYRLGIIGVLEGRFAAAYASYKKAREEGRSLGQRGNLESTGTLRLLAPLVAPEDTAKWDEDLAQIFKDKGSPAMGAAVRVEARLRGATPGHCPSFEERPKEIPAEAWATTRIYRLRAAAAAGCASCAAVVAAGRQPNEYTSESLLHFAVCAESEQHWELARDALRSTSPLGLDPIETNLMLTSAFVSVETHFYLARALAALGNAAAARAEYQAFIGYWGNADRPIAQVDEARRALQSLDAAAKGEPQTAAVAR